MLPDDRDPLERDPASTGFKPHPMHHALKPNGRSHMNTVNKGRRLRISFEIDLPETATREQVFEWLGMELTGSGIDGDNPLIAHDLEGENRTIEDTGTYRTYEVSDIKKNPETNGVSYRMTSRVNADHRDPAEAENWLSASETSNKAIAPFRTR